MSDHDKDEVEGRGPWMQTSSGGQFFPATPRPEDVRLTDIANGLALDCRYAGQCRIDRFYSVAEHSALMAAYALDDRPEAAAVVLLHDAAEAYLNDLVHAVKCVLGAPYAELEDRVQGVIWERYGLTQRAEEHRDYVKDLDRRMVPLEKAAIMRTQRAWAADRLEPLERVSIRCLPPIAAKKLFVSAYWLVCQQEGWNPEEVAI